VRHRPRAWIRWCSAADHHPWSSAAPQFAAGAIQQRDEGAKSAPPLQHPLLRGESPPRCRCWPQAAPAATPPGAGATVDKVALKVSRPRRRPCTAPAGVEVAGGLLLDHVGSVVDRDIPTQAPLPPNRTTGKASEVVALDDPGHPSWSVVGGPLPISGSITIANRSSGSAVTRSRSERMPGEMAGSPNR